MKMLRAWRVGMLLPLMLAALAVTAQTRTLNPTVRVLSQPTKPVPAECAQGLAPQPMPRVQVAELPPPVEKAAAVAPPSNTLRGQLAAVQEAAQGGDRDTFRDALARARATLSNYPGGAERDAAQSAVKVYTDLDRLWTYQFESPTGAFFDDSTDLVAMMNGYQGWSAAMADQTLNVGGTRLYPTRESRDFLVREAARRVSRLGVGTAPVPRTTQRTPATPMQKGTTATKTGTATRKSGAGVSSARREPSGTSSRSSRHTTATSTRQPSGKTVQSSRAGRSSATSRSTASHGTSTSSAGSMAVHQPSKSTHVATTPAVKSTKPPTAVAATPATSTHAPATATHAPATSTHAPVTPPPAVASTSTHSGASAPTATTAPAPSTTAPATATTASSTSTASATTDTSSTTSEPATASTDTASTSTTSTATATTDTVATSSPQPARGKNVIIPIILIIIGLGVLVVLFRASGQ